MTHNWLVLKFKPLRHSTTSISEFCWDAKRFSRLLKNVIKCRTSIQALSLKKLPCQLLQELRLHLFFSLTPSHSGRPVVSLEDLCETPLLLLSQLLEQESQPHRLEIRGFGGTRGTRWRSRPLSPLQNASDLFALLDLLKVSPLPTAPLRGQQLSPLLCLRVWAAVPSLLYQSPTLSVLLSSCPALLPFLLSLLWLVGFSRSLSCYFHTVVLRL